MSDIRDGFGDEVATLVDGASEPEELINAKGGKSKTWPERKAHTIEFIKNAGRDMKLLSCAGKLANLRDIISDYDRLGDDVWDIFNASRTRLHGITIHAGGRIRTLELLREWTLNLSLLTPKA